MKIGLLKNFLHYFNLRQGTLLIALFQLVISTFLYRIYSACLTKRSNPRFMSVICKNLGTQFISGLGMLFFILALAHAMGIQEMVVRDTEDALEREALEEISSNHLNTKRMDLAHHNATGY